MSTVMGAYITSSYNLYSHSLGVALLVSSNLSKNDLKHKCIYGNSTHFSIALGDHTPRGWSDYSMDMEFHERKGDSLRQ